MNMKNEVKNYLTMCRCSRRNSPNRENYFYESCFSCSFKLDRRAYQILKAAAPYEGGVSKHEIVCEVFGPEYDRPGYHSHTFAALNYFDLLKYNICDRKLHITDFGREFIAICEQ